MSRAASLKRWPGWVLLVLVVAGLLAVGSTRDAGARTPEERVEEMETLSSNLPQRIYLLQC